MNGSRHLRRVAGVDLHWVEVGAGRPLVLLHGLADSHRTWKRAAGFLARDHRVLMLDLPGHGLSERPDASYALAWHARMVADWIDDLGLEEVDVAGHSFGGGVAQQLLLERRERVRRLALVSSGGLGREVVFGLRLLTATTLVEHIGQPFMGLATRLSMLAAPDAFDNEDRSFQSWTNSMPGTARAIVRTARDVVDWKGQRRHILDGAHTVRELPPISVFWGERDSVIPIVHGEDTHVMLDGSTFTRFAGCGHFPHRERPEAFARALLAFVDAPNARPTRIRHGHSMVLKSPRKPGFLRRLAAAIGRRWKRAGTVPTAA